MGARAALVVAVDRGAVLVPAGRRPEEVHLRRQELAGEDVALAEADDALDVERGDHFAMQHQIAEAGEERLDRGLHGVAEVLPLGVPVTALQLIRCVLDEARHHVLAGRGHVGIDERLQARVDVRPLAVPPVLGIVVRPLEVVHRRADVGEPTELIGAIAEGRIAGGTIEGEVDLGRRALEPEPANALVELDR